MKRKMKEVFLAVLLGAIIPSIIFEAVLAKVNVESAPTDEPLEVTNTTQTIDTRFFIPVILADGQTLEMELNDYVAGVVLAEMPAVFDEEAIKAQAVVARTYALKQHSTGQKHPQGAVCTNSACCQAYISNEAYLEEPDMEQFLNKVHTAVAKTEYEVLTYNQMLIEATYFSCSGGMTEDALAVWGTDVPYLRSVDSPGEEKAAHYVDTVSFRAADFLSAMEIDMQGLPSTWFGEVTYTNGGGVDTIEIGNILYDGKAMRERLGLRSTMFRVTAVGDTITITTKGYGHRVGMSQYGAEAMAVQGSDYRTILAHYYQNTKLENYPPDE